MDHQITVYTAGNPDNFPLEYYNTETESFEGLLPILYREFSDQSPYEIVYYKPGMTDQRNRLMKNKQVDFVSGYNDREGAPQGGKPVDLFTVEDADGEYNCQIYFTDVAPKELQEDMEFYFSGVSQKEICSGLLKTTDDAPTPKEMTYLAEGLGVLLIAILVTAAVIIRKYRQKVQLYKMQMEIDPVTHIGNRDHLKRYFFQRVQGKNRVLYHAVYFLLNSKDLRRCPNKGSLDEFLRYCAVVLRQHSSEQDILARVSDDGFVIFKMIARESDLEEWIIPVFEHIADYSAQEKQGFQIGMHAGLYALKNDDMDLDEIILNARHGALVSEREDKSFLFCSNEIVEKFKSEQSLYHDILKGLDAQQFQLYIQFFVDSATEEFVGGEALSRWNHPRKGILNPGSYIELMEQEGVISQLDYYNLRAVCEFLERLLYRGVDEFFISCNFSRGTFGAPDFAEKSLEILDAYTFPKELLIFEMTESVYDYEAKNIQKNIRVLKQHGIRIALDDFDDGASSSYDLQKHTFDGIKIPKGFIDNVETENGYRVVKSMIQLGHDLDATILVEGVETERQFRIMQGLHADVIQGYYFYYPMPDWEVEEMITKKFKKESE